MIPEEEFFQECLKFLDYFDVDYKGDVIYLTDWGNSCICNPESEFIELFGGMSINCVSKYVAKKMGKDYEWKRDRDYD